jgi:hypothetical protein
MGRGINKICKSMPPIRIELMAFSWLVLLDYETNALPTELRRHVIDGRLLAYGNQ